MTGGRSTDSQWNSAFGQCAVESPEAGLEAFRQCDDGGLGMIAEVGNRAPVDSQRTQRHFLAFAAELVEVEVDGVDKPDRHRIVDDRVRPTGLVGPAVEGEQCGLGDAGQHRGVYSLIGFVIHWNRHYRADARVRALTQDG